MLTAHAESGRTGLVQSIGWLSLAKLSAQLVSWSATLVVMRILDPRDYGIAGLAAVLFGLVATLADFGLRNALTQEKAPSEEMKRQVAGLALLIALVCGAGFTLLGQVLAVVYEQPLLRIAAFLHSLALVFSALGIVPNSQLDRELRFRTVAMCEISSTMIAAAFALAGALAGLGIWVLLLSQVVTAAAHALSYNVATRGQRMPAVPRRDLVRRFVEFGVSVAPSRLMYYLENSLDMLIGGKILSPRAIGFYNVAVYWSNVPLGKMMVVLNQALYPFFAAKARDEQDITHDVERLVRAVTLLAIPVFWGLAAVAEPLIDLLLGEKWADVLLPMQILCLAIPLRMVLESLTNPLQARRELRTLVRNHTGSLLAVALGCIFGAPYGPVGLAAGVAAGIVIGNTIALNRSLRRLRVSRATVAASASRVGLAGAVMLGTVYGIDRVLVSMHVHPGPILLAQVLTGTLVYAGLVALLERNLSLTIVQAIRSARTKT